MIWPSVNVTLDHGRTIPHAHTLYRLFVWYILDVGQYYVSDLAIGCVCVCVCVCGVDVIVGCVSEMGTPSNQVKHSWQLATVWLCFS